MQQAIIVRLLKNVGETTTIYLVEFPFRLSLTESRQKLLHPLYTPVNTMDLTWNET